jgi:hypothetical protein
MDQRVQVRIRPSGPITCIVAITDVFTISAPDARDKKARYAVTGRLGGRDRPVGFIIRHFSPIFGDVSDTIRDVRQRLLDCEPTIAELGGETFRLHGGPVDQDCPLCLPPDSVALGTSSRPVASFRHGYPNERMGQIIPHDVSAWFTNHATAEYSRWLGAVANPLVARGVVRHLACPSLFNMPLPPDNYFLRLSPKLLAFLVLWFNVHVQCRLPAVLPSWDNLTVDDMGRFALIITAPVRVGDHLPYYGINDIVTFTGHDFDGFELSRAARETWGGPR